MNRRPPEESEQRAMWNGAAGRAWVESQELLDRMFRPFEEELVRRAPAEAAPRVLDVGCGTGATTLALARARQSMRACASCVGVDVSAPMIALARARAAAEGSIARFELGDAQTHSVEPARFDAIVSRFGVMFFDDPIAAFGNLRRATVEGATLRAFVWRSPAENPFMTAAERAAAPLLPAPPPRRPDAPGQFAFADADRVRGILHASGWRDAELSPVDVPCAFPAADLERYATKMGPVARAADELSAPIRAEVLARARGALGAFVDGADVRFVAACWLVSARA